MNSSSKVYVCLVASLLILTGCGYEGELHPGKPPFVMAIPTLKNLEPSMVEWVNKHSSKKGYWVKQDVDRTYLLVSLGSEEGNRTTFSLDSFKRMAKQLSANFLLIPASKSVATQQDHFKLYVIKPAVKSGNLTINLEWATPETQ